MSGELNNSRDEPIAPSKVKKTLKWWDGYLREGVDVRGQVLTLNFDKIKIDTALTVIRDMLLAMNIDAPAGNSTILAVEHINNALRELGNE